jgi:hypothetical protein
MIGRKRLRQKADGFAQKKLFSYATCKKGLGIKDEAF